MRKAIRDAIYVDVDAARDHQDAKFGWIGDSRSGLASTDEGRKLRILVEEVGEVARALNDAPRGGSPAKLHHELLQVAACAVAWVEADRERRLMVRWCSESDDGIHHPVILSTVDGDETICDDCGESMAAFA